jgi:hypothetical protein
MNVLAPEFNALMTIFLSVGPVISTLENQRCRERVPQTTYRLSSRPGAGGAQDQAKLFLISSVSFGNESDLPYLSALLTLKEINGPTASSCSWTFFLFSNNSLRRASNVLCKTARNSIASVEIIDSVPFGGESVKWTPWGNLPSLIIVYIFGI